MVALPDLGVGLGYRTEIHNEIIANRTEIDWLEIITDQYLNRPDQHAHLAGLRQDFTLVPHSVEMSVGSDLPLDDGYLDAVVAVAELIDAPWASDHLCFTREHGVQLGSLTPVVRTREKARAIAANAQRVQARLARPFLLENITYYVDPIGDLTEAEMINEVLEHCDCGLLLDLNNLALNAANHGFDARAFLDSIPLERVIQVHLAGNAPGNEISGVRLDSHDAPIADEVFELLAYVTRRTSPKGVLIERDEGFPDDFAEILGDVTRSKAVIAGGNAP